jgi:glycosyltransferase involved in cell wall biosynthesis
MSSETGISVVIPTFNNVATLGDAVQSVLGQDWPRIELIVVDDGSTDDTPRFLEELVRHEPLRVRTLSQSNGGAGSARNAGIDAATHDLVAFLDADDVWLPRKLRAQMAEFARSPETAVCFTGYSRTGVGPPRDVVMRSWDPSTLGVLDALLEGCCVTPPTVLARRDALIKVGLFDTELRCCEDHDLWFRLAVAGRRFSYLPAPYAHVRARRSSLSADESEVARCSDLVYERLFASGDLPEEIQVRSQFYLARCYLNSACRHLDQGDGPASLRSLWKATTTRPRSVRPGWLRIASTAAARSLRSQPGVA